jgi:hypothetical protein
MELPKQASMITVKDMPGIFYSLLGEYLSEKLPLIIFTNRASFKISLDF